MKISSKSRQTKGKDKNPSTFKTILLTIKNKKIMFGILINAAVAGGLAYIGGTWGNAAGGFMYDFGYCTWEYITDKENGLFSKEGGKK